MVNPELFEHHPSPPQKTPDPVTLMPLRTLYTHSHSNLTTDCINPDHLSPSGPLLQHILYERLPGLIGAPDQRSTSTIKEPHV